MMHLPVLFVAIISLCSTATASPVQGRQVAPGNSSTANLIAQCAPYSFIIHQFTTFSGSDTAPPQISFFFTNENGVDVNGGLSSASIFCSVTLPKNSDVMSDYQVWSCQVRFPFKDLLCNGTDIDCPERNRFDTNSVLTVSQSMICDALWPGSVSVSALSTPILIVCVQSSDMDFGKWNHQYYFPPRGRWWSLQRFS
jgi:hypothetical protein